MFNVQFQQKSLLTLFESQERAKLKGEREKKKKKCYHKVLYNKKV